MAWLKRALVAYLIVWALYFGVAMYLQPPAGASGNRISVWQHLGHTSLWPYVLFRVWYAPDLASGLRGDPYSDKRR